MTTDAETPRAILSKTVPAARRFSLRALLLIVGVLCLAASNAVAVREMAHLREENRRLRDELGYLSIEDPAKFHAVSARQQEELRWRWRIYVPPHRQLAFCVTWGAENQEPTRLPAHDLAMPPGEHALDASLERDPNGHWSMRLTDADRTAGIAVTRSWRVPSSVAGRLRSTTRVKQLPAAGTVAFGAGDRIVLLEEYMPEATLYGGTAESRGAGLAAWVEQREPWGLR